MMRLCPGALVGGPVHPRRPDCTGSDVAQRQDIPACESVRSLRRCATSAHTRPPFAPSPQDDLALDGEPRKYSPATLRALTAYGLPRPLHKELQAGQATTVVREDTVRLLERIRPSAQGEGEGSRRILLCGSGGPAVPIATPR